MNKVLSFLLISTAALSLGACVDSTQRFDRELGSGIDSGSFGNATMNNTLIQTGQMEYTMQLANRFAAEVPDTITFAFNSAELTPAARDVIKRQAHWIRQFPEVRFRVYGHTDLVGSAGYNQALGLRRAQAVVAYLSQNGVSRSRLEAVVSYGKTQPIVQTNAAEERNRRTVTEVSGFVESNPLILDGKYAAVVFREYVRSATRIHPANTEILTQTDPSAGG